jgi:hypothetical protein
MNDLEFSIVDAFEALGGEADIADVYDRLDANQQRIRRAILKDLGISEDDLRKA